MSDEQWRTIARNTAYEVSSEGRVRRKATGRILRGAANSRGYVKLNLGRQQQVYVHQLVCEAFHGPRPGPSHQVDHLNFDRTDNAADNLRWLELLINCVRWKDRTSDGRNVWSTPDEPPDEDHEPMTDQERAEWEQSVEAWSA